MKRKVLIEDAPVTPRKFVEAWQTSGSVREVAARLAISKNACRIRASRYRRLGVGLKNHPPPEVSVTDWDELADYAASLLPGKGAGGGSEGVAGVSAVEAGGEL
jgi:hypothetical protein